MLKPLFIFEKALLRVESWLLVFSVLLMLGLASYTVFYRNVLIPWQNDLATSGPPVVEEAEEAPPESDEAGGGFGGGFGVADDEAGEEEAEDGAGGFGGGFGAADEDSEEAEEEAEDGAGGFGGGFGAAGEETEDAEDESEDGAGGFGGGFGADEEDAAEGAADEGAEESPPPAEPDAASAPNDAGGPPPEGSLAAWLVDAINALKFYWIDILLRQLVIITGFLGAMLATRRRNHITIDAVGKLLKGRTEHIVHVVTNLVAAAVCVWLALSGMDLVDIGMEFPRELLPWAKQWHFQLAFPIGWGLLAFHFLMRVIESLQWAISDPEGGYHADADEEDAA